MIILLPPPIDGQPTTPPAGPVEPPPPVLPDVTTEALSWRFTGADGSVWPLTDWSSPLIKLRGATGAGAPAFEHWWAEESVLDGADWQGGRTTRGEVFLPLMLRGRDSADYLAKHRAFMRALNPRGEGVIRVTAPDTSWREARVRYRSGADFAINLDPVKAHRATYGITWDMAEPFWAGETVSREFEYDPGAAFFPGPPWVLGKPVVLDNNTSVTNPGDEDAYAVWRITGPFTGFRVGVGGAVVALTLNMVTGQFIEIDMNRRKKTIVDETGADRWLSATDADFVPIPPGDDVPLAVSVTGPAPGTSVQLSFRPRYRGAW